MNTYIYIYIYINVVVSFVLLFLCVRNSNIKTATICVYISNITIHSRTYAGIFDSIHAMPEASVLDAEGTQSDTGYLRSDSRNSEDLPRCKLQAPRKTPAAPMSPDGAQFAPIVNLVHEWVGGAKGENLLRTYAKIFVV